MTHSEFVIGADFMCGGRRWRCTDIGTRTIVAISLKLPRRAVNYTPGKGLKTVLSSDPTWFNGPPYAVQEIVFDEYDLPGCSLLTR